MTPRTLLKILVVEDDPTVASQLTSFLMGLGWHVDFAASGKMAIRFCQQQTYDAVLLDVAMPDMPGEMILQHIKRCGNVPVLLMSASASAEIHCRFTGADDVVPDPADYRDIVSRCQRFVAQGTIAITA